MARATIIVDVTHPEAVAASDRWFAKWAAKLSYRSDNQGCGCCVDIWDVEGTDEAIDAIPSDIRSYGEWVESGTRKN